MKLALFHFSFGDNGAQVATITVPDVSDASYMPAVLELVYMLSQNMEDPWINNKEVELTVAGAVRADNHYQPGVCNRSLRSTSVGDEVAVVDENGVDQDGFRWVVASVGFLPKAEALDDPFVVMHRTPRTRG